MRTREIGAVLATIVGGLTAPLLGQSRQFMGEQGHEASLPILSTDRLAAVADVDGDGRSDIVVVEGAGLRLHRRLGGGVYQSGLRIILPSVVVLQASHLRCADFDGDGDADVLVATTSTLQYFWNNGAGGFAANRVTVVNLPGLMPTGTLAVGDLDGDGATDVARAALDSVKICTTALAVPSVTTVASSSAGVLFDLCLSDLDGDGDLDLATTMNNAAGGMRLFLNDGSGRFPTEWTTPVLTRPRGIGAGDFDRDGDVDIIVAVTANYAILDQRSPGVFVDVASTMPTLSSVSPSGTWVLDLDDDGDLDVYSAGFSSVVLINDGAGRFVDRTTARHQAVTFVEPVNVADFDQDGDLDLANRVVFPTVALTIDINHVRQLESIVALRPGSTAELRLFYGPGFGSAGVAFVFGSLQPAVQSIAVPGIVGMLDLEMAAAAHLATVITSPVGVSSVFYSVPGSAALVGTSIVQQFLEVPSSGSAGFSNALTATVQL